MPSFALNIATVVLVGGSLIEAQKQTEQQSEFLSGATAFTMSAAEAMRQEQTALMTSTARAMRQEQADANAEIRQKISEYLSKLANRTEAVALPPNR
ncbi:hypothetical protein [Bradyrhizobium sp. DASA03007]|uniref:hypothetical protein n=1 Tax=unclassified Bradyrhizobium TaxID=2631580 RepID=UPI003F6EF3DF